MKRKFSSQQSKDITSPSLGGGNGGGNAQAAALSLFPFPPLLSPSPSTVDTITPSSPTPQQRLPLHPNVQTTSNTNAKRPNLPPAQKVRKVSATHAVKLPPQPKTAPKAAPVALRRPLQALKPKPESHTVAFLPAQRLNPTNNLTTLSNLALQTPTSDTLAQLDLIASCLTPLSTSATTPATSQAPLIQNLNPLSLAGARNCFFNSKISQHHQAFQQSSGVSPATAQSLASLQAGGLTSPLLGLGGGALGLSGFPFLNPLDLNYINNVSKFSLPSKLMLNHDLAQAHNLFLQHPHLLQTPLELSKAVASPTQSASATTTTSSSSSTGNGSHGQKIKPSLIPALKLSIGKWERNATFLGEVCAKFYYSKKKIVWEIMTLGLMAKMEIEFADIIAVEFTMPAEGQSIMTVQVKKPPRFFGEINPRPGKNIQWTESTDFTGGHASTNARHVLTFPKASLIKHYEKLISCDNRLKDLAKAGLGALKSAPATFSPAVTAPPSLSSLSPLTTLHSPPTPRGMDALFKAAGIYSSVGSGFHAGSSGPALNLNLNLVGGLGGVSPSQSPAIVPFTPTAMAAKVAQPAASPASSPLITRNATTATTTTNSTVNAMIESLKSSAVADLLQASAEGSSHETACTDTILPGVEDASLSSLSGASLLPLNIQPTSLLDADSGDSVVLNVSESS